MKTIVVGDTHGRSFWKLIRTMHDWDLFIFMGDYFDTRENISTALQLYNFIEITKFKEENPENVKLLIGNHDFHYLEAAVSVKERYSGYQVKQAYQITYLIEEKKKWLQMCYTMDNYIFTHAGITKTWLESVGIPEDENLEFNLNELFKYRPLQFNFNNFGMGTDLAGDDIYQGPLWVRPLSLKKDKIGGIHVVGHTSVPHIGVDKSGIVLTDALGTSGEFLVIQDGDLKVDSVFAQKAEKSAIKEH